MAGVALAPLVEVGTNVRALQTRIGHSSSKVGLTVYARATAEADRRAAEAIGAYRRPKVALQLPTG